MKNNLCKMTKKNLAFASAFIGMSLFAACSSTDDKGVAGGVSEDAGFVADVAGVAQKGPFVKGATVTVRGIDCKTLEFTDQVFEGAIKSDKGDFALDSVALDASCAVIEVSGKYLNEVTGKKTKNELTLRALTDLKDRDNVNVNLLTNLEYERVMHLVKEKNKTLAKAKTQAESEVLAAFDIKGDFEAFENLNLLESGDGNAALLAVSVMMQGDTDVDGLVKRLDKFDDSFAESGKWKDSETKKAIAEWVAEAAASGELETIRKNIEDMGYAGEIPAFEKYIPAVEPADSTGEESSSREESSSSVEVSSSSDVVTSSESEPKIDSTKQSSSSKQDSRDSVVTSSSSGAVADTVLSSSAKADSLERDTIRSSSSFVEDTSKTDVQDSVKRDSSVYDSIDPAIYRMIDSIRSTRREPSNPVSVKDSAACADENFPWELENLLGNSVERLALRCDEDTIVVNWRIRHTTKEYEDTLLRNYVLAADEDQEATDSLTRFREEWLDTTYGYVAVRNFEYSRNDLMEFLWGYSYTDVDADISRIGDKVRVYYYSKRLKNFVYTVVAYPMTEVIMETSSVRTIRYGFILDVYSYYITK